MSITLTQFQQFVLSVESSIKNDVAGFKGFGSTLSEDVGNFTVDVEKVFNWGLAAFQLSGNAEASVLAPIAAFAEGAINSIESALGIGSAATAPASVTAAAGAIASGTSAAVPPGSAPAAPATAPVATPPKANPFNTGDGTHVGDDPDAGAIGG